MILSNRDILEAIDAGDIVIDPLPHRNPGEAPFNTTAIDLRLAATIMVPQKLPAAQRLDALEMINLSPNGIQLVPDVYVCQLIFERVSNEPANARNQFSGQVDPAGSRA